ncbi:Hypothetical predicted protein [Paramuricea clavata]|uniref:Uncharacterized protein n=1 Tax=Paramuricea clavata TaxID=317549 RepID=A0A7D9HHP7_PARCT|nr:Hypothetical predicted protein [Paramuricea clavata]
MRRYLGFIKTLSKRQIKKFRTTVLVSLKLTHCQNTCSEDNLVDKIANFAKDKGSQSQTDLSENTVFKTFVEQFAPGEQTGPAIDHDLATIVNELLTEKLTKEKLEPVQDKYLKPENCENLVAPKINKPIWQQLKQETKNTDSAFQKIQQLSLSSLYAVLQVCSENCAGASNGDTSYSVVANYSSLFHKRIEFVNRDTKDIQDESGTSSLDQSTSSASEFGIDGMQIIRYSLHERNISPEIANIIMLSRRNSTHKQYRVYINKWVHFCSEKSFDPVHPTVNTLLAFLHQLHENNLGYSGLNTARSAVSNIDENSVHTKMHTPVGKHRLVCLYLKGIFNKLKPIPKFNNIWSVDIVLEHLSVLWPLDELTRKASTLKLVNMLIVLTTGQRCQTLTFMDISDKYMTKNE